MKTPTMFYVYLGKGFEFQILLPKLSRPSFGTKGFALHLKSSLIISNRSFALSILGFGIAIAKDQIFINMHNNKRVGFE